MRKHIVCFGDSNTHGYCADPKDCAEGGNRFSEEERWTCLLQKKLGDSALVIEEGLSGRTTVFTDPLHESMAGLDSIYSVLMSHEPVDLLIIMLGTNDTKERFGANAACIGIGMERLILKAKSIPCWRKSSSSPRPISARDCIWYRKANRWAGAARRNHGIPQSTSGLSHSGRAAVSWMRRESRNSTRSTACT